MNRASLPLTERIKRSSDPDPDSGCWNWKRSIGTTGYGTLKTGSKKDGSWKTRMAHRVSFEAFVGPVPAGMFVCHRCDNRRCVNPEHLFAGTVADNNADMTGKGRRYRKVTDERVREIRTLYAAGIGSTTIARNFGISENAVLKIAFGKVWRSAGGEILEGAYPRCLRRVLSFNEVDEIRTRYWAGGVTQLELCSEYGVGKGTIHRALHPGVG